MAALAAPANRSHLERSPFNPIVKNGSTNFKGSFVGFEHSSGHQVPLDDAADRSYIGESMETVVGDGTKTCGVIFVPYILKNAAVTGYTAVTKNWEPVYATTDNDLTLTRQADDSQLVGITCRFDSSGVGDVLMLGALAHAIMRLAGADKEEMELLSIPLASIADDMKISKTLYGHGRVIDIFVQAVIPASTPAKTATLTADLNGDAITGAAGAFATADLNTAGDKERKAASAANEFHDGDVLNIVASSVTAFSEGYGIIGVTIQRLP